VDGARSALRDAASEFGADQIKVIPQDPENRRIRRYIDLVLLPVDCKIVCRHGVWTKEGVGDWDDCRDFTPHPQ
jgi:hypothetical protein